jgi:hypothetical protein
MIFFIIPKPDVLIFVKSDPEVIYSRKTDLVLNEIRRQSEVCELIANGTKNGLILNNNTLDESTNKILAMIIDKIKL